MRSRTELMFQVASAKAMTRDQPMVMARSVSPSTWPSSVSPFYTAATPSGVPE